MRNRALDGSDVEKEVMYQFDQGRPMVVRARFSDLLDIGKGDVPLRKTIARELSAGA